MSELGWRQARDTAAAATAPLPAVDAALVEAVGRVLAAPLDARTALPAFDTAAMDGYACAGPGPWRLVGEVRAGDRSDRVSLAAGTAVAICTGAELPAGADRVLRREQARLDDAGAAHSLEGAAARGACIRPAGEECRAGARLAPVGAEVTPALLGLAAAGGHDVLSVHRHPVLRLVVTGDELSSSGAAGAGRVRDALTPLLVPALEAAGALVVASRCGDDADAMRGALTGPTDPDVVVVTGSTSRGRADHLRSVLAGLGADLLVPGVRCRPGHPMLLARLADGTVVVGLPGNPLAAVAAVLTLLVPVLDTMAAREPAPAAWAEAPGIARHPTDTRLVPVRLGGGVAEPTGGDGSGMLSGLARADAIAVAAPASDASGGSRTVRLLELPGGPGGHRHDARMLGAA